VLHVQHAFGDSREIIAHDLKCGHVHIVGQIIEIYLRKKCMKFVYGNISAPTLSWSPWNCRNMSTKSSFVNCVEKRDCLRIRFQMPKGQKNCAWRLKVCFGSWVRHHQAVTHELRVQGSDVNTTTSATGCPTPSSSSTGRDQACSGSSYLWIPHVPSICTPPPPGSIFASLPSSVTHVIQRDSTSSCLKKMTTM